MNNTAEQQVVPPAWSSQFQDYFVNLKTWILEKAYPALIKGPLSSDPTIQAIPVDIVQLEDDLKQHLPIPIALVGLTGVGKSTLLNALLEQEILPVGVIGSQTAAFVTIRHAEQWEITCNYIESHELAAMFSEAGAETNDSNETGSPEEIERAERRVRALLGLKDDQPLPSRDTLRLGPPHDIQEIVDLKERRFSQSDEYRMQLELHAKGKLWPITRSIDIRGPFQMLESGVVISDLPGAGDLNRARANQAATAIEQAGQVLIAVDNKLLQTSLIDQLEGSGRLPHRLFKSGENVQIILVGTSLDAKLPDPEDDARQVEELGLDPTKATKEDIFKAVCTSWANAIRPQFINWLHVKSKVFLPDLSEQEQQARVQHIVARLKVIPTSAKDWNRYKHQKEMKVCRVPEDTGMSLLRDSINALADAQIETTKNTLRQKIIALQRSVLASIERSEATAGADINGILAALERSENTMKEVQGRHTQIVEDLRLSILGRFQQIRETLIDKIEIACHKMRQMGREQVLQHLSDLHWASLRATVNHQGYWRTRYGRQVNLRDAMGGEMTRLVPQAWSRIADERVGKSIEEAKHSIVETLSNFTVDIKGIVDAEVADEISKQTVNNLFEASLGRAEHAIERSAASVTKLLGDTSKKMQQLVDEAVDQSLDGVCDGCSQDSGIGWSRRSVSKIVEGTSTVADGARARCINIADSVLDKLSKSIEAFCETANNEMLTIGKSIPLVLKNAVAQSKLTTPKAQKQALHDAKSEAPELLEEMVHS